jgi:DNA (cytosine-5)-methyltransferase 1
MPANDNPADRGIAVELCCGLGGIGIGLRALGFSVARAYDAWDEAVDVYNHNAPSKVAAKCNVLSTAGRDLIAADCRELNDIQLMAAGPPCKGFSRLKNGFHDGRNGQNRVLRAMPEYVALLRPRMFLIENVPDLARHRDGKTLASLIKQLERPTTRLRYRVDYGVFDAAAFGTPQARKRILIFGVRRDSGDEKLPNAGRDLAPLFAALRHGGTIPAGFEEFHAALVNPGNRQLVSADQALSDLPLFDPGREEGAVAYASKPKTAYQHWVRHGASNKVGDIRTPTVTDKTLARLQHIPPGGCARSIPEAHLNGLARRYDSAYRRLHPDAPSTALSTKYDCVYHYAKQRSLSVREYARLQAIPDLFTFPSSLTSRRSAYEMIGNSVPPLLIESVLAAALSVDASK